MKVGGRLEGFKRGESKLIECKIHYPIRFFSIILHLFDVIVVWNIQHYYLCGIETNMLSSHTKIPNKWLCSQLFLVEVWSIRVEKKTDINVRKLFMNEFQGENTKRERTHKHIANNRK